VSSTCAPVIKRFIKRRHPRYFLPRQAA